MPVTQPTLSYPDFKKRKLERVCLCATVFIFFGLLGLSPLCGVSSVPVADNHSGAGLEALGRWDMEKCVVPLFAELALPLCHTHTLWLF